MRKKFLVLAAVMAAALFAVGPANAGTTTRAAAGGWLHLTTDFHTGTSCTMGAWGTVNGVPTLLTAGHCLPTGSKYVSYSLGNGTMTNYELDATAEATDGNDVGTVTIPDAGNAITSQHYNGPADTSAPGTSVQQTHSAGPAVLGTTVCVARARGYVCGKETYVSGDGNIGYMALTVCKSGDSGSPVYAKGGAEFVGILAACNSTTGEFMTYPSIQKSFPNWVPFLAP